MSTGRSWKLCLKTVSNAILSWKDFGICVLGVEAKLSCMYRKIFQNPNDLSYVIKVSRLYDYKSEDGHGKIIHFQQVLEHPCHAGSSHFEPSKAAALLPRRGRAPYTTATPPCSSNTPAAHGVWSMVHIRLAFVQRVCGVAIAQVVAWPDEWWSANVWTLSVYVCVCLSVCVCVCRPSLLTLRTWSGVSMICDSSLNKDILNNKIPFLCQCGPTQVSTPLFKYKLKIHLFGLSYPPSTLVIRLLGCRMMGMEWLEIGCAEQTGAIKLFNIHSFMHSFRGYTWQPFGYCSHCA